MSPERNPDEVGRLVISRESKNSAPFWLSKESWKEYSDIEEEYYNQEITWGEYCLVYQLDPMTGENLNSIGSRRVMEEAEAARDLLEPASRGMSADDFQDGMRQMKAFEAQRPQFNSLQVYSASHGDTPLEDFGFKASVTDAGGLQANGFLSESEIAAFGRWILETYNLPGRVNVSSVQELKELVSSFLTVEILLKHPSVRDAINQFVQVLEMRH